MRRNLLQSAQTQKLELGLWPRHRHRHGYAALVLSGSYEEAGDTGRWFVEEGDIVYHRAYEAHRNDVLTDCSILNIAIPSHLHLPAVFRVRDPDSLILAATSGIEGILEEFVPSSTKRPRYSDWPDLLARDLLSYAVHLGDWAKDMGLRPETLSRGFRRAFGTTPARYRLEAQGRSAIRLIVETDKSLADIAYLAGFADQSHLSRSILELTGCTPAGLRRVKSVQECGDRPS